MHTQTHTHATRDQVSGLTLGSRWVLYEMVEHRCESAFRLNECQQQSSVSAHNWVFSHLIITITDSRNSSMVQTCNTGLFCVSSLVPYLISRPIRSSSTQPMELRWWQGDSPRRAYWLEATWGFTIQAWLSCVCNAAEDSAVGTLPSCWSVSLPIIWSMRSAVALQHWWDIENKAALLYYLHQGGHSMWQQAVNKITQCYELILIFSFVKCW